MTLHVPQPSPAHRAALRLHALPEEDRAWVLAALPADQQSILRQLLRELEALGIPRDADLLQPFGEGDGDEARSPGLPLHALDAAAIRQLAAVLAAEPPRLAAALLAAGDWEWREQLVAGLPVALADEVRQVAGVSQQGPAFHRAVIAETARTLASAPGERPPVSRWQAWRRRLRAMGRAR
jgi:hypothetical protein